MTTTHIRLPRHYRTAVRALPYAGVATATALALAACGPSATAGGSGAPAASSTSAPTGTGGTGGGQRQPGVNGLIAAVNGSTMQVQTRTDQTAVSWTDSTTFTTVGTAALADVTVGSCVTVLEPAGSGSSETPTTQATAASVDVRPATNGACGGFGGFGGAGGAGAPGGGPGAGATPPPGAPTGSATTGTGGRGNGDGRRAVGGLVTAVSGDTITVQETMRARGNGTATATASPTTASVTVTTTSSTAFTAQKAGTASDVAVGKCATAIGKADDTGAVAATSITLRPATNGSCTTGFGGGPGGGRGGATGTATTTSGGANG